MHSIELWGCSMFGFQRAQEEYESRMFDPFAEGMDPEEMQDIADDIGNAQYDEWHDAIAERQAEIDEQMLWNL